MRSATRCSSCSLRRRSSSFAWLRWSSTSCSRSARRASSIWVSSIVSPMRSTPRSIAPMSWTSSSSSPDPGGQAADRRREVAAEQERGEQSDRGRAEGEEDVAGQRVLGRPVHGGAGNREGDDERLALDGGEAPDPLDAVGALHVDGLARMRQRRRDLRVAAAGAAPCRARRSRRRRRCESKTSITLPGTTGGSGSSRATAARVGLRARLREQRREELRAGGRPRLRAVAVGVVAIAGRVGDEQDQRQGGDGRSEHDAPATR